MRSAAKPVRPSKREVITIDDEESTSEQPAAKSVKREAEPDPSPVVLDLQQKLSKTEENFQRACRAARTAELRAEAAESRLDSKYGIKDEFRVEKNRADELETRLAVVSKQLEDARRGAESVDDLARENEALKAEMAEMRQEHQDRVNNLTIQRDDERQRVRETLSRTEERTKQIRKEHQERLNKLTIQRDEERQKARESQAKDRARIDELTKKIAQYESSEMQQQQLQQLPTAKKNPGVEETLAPNIPVVQGGLELHKIGDPTDIFQLCDPDSSESMSLAAARSQLFKIVEKAEGNSLYRKVMRCFGRLPLRDWQIMTHCDVCHETFKNPEIIYHFLSKGHLEKASALGATVSRTALNHWVDMLQPQQ